MLNQIIISICKERFWALPAHVDFSHLDEKTIDLFAAETAQSLAEILLIMGGRLPHETVALAQEEIMNRVLTPFCTSAFPYSWWETDRCNWSAVCAGSIGIAAIAMDKMESSPPRGRSPASGGCAMRSHAIWTAWNRTERARRGLAIFLTA